MTGNYDKCLVKEYLSKCYVEINNIPSLIPFNNMGDIYCVLQVKKMATKCYYHIINVTTIVELYFLKVVHIYMKTIKISIF